MVEKRIEMLIKECEKEINSVGLSLPKIDYGYCRGKNRIAVCKTKGANLPYEMKSFKIDFSKHYVEEFFKHNKIKEFKEVILHEMCHALPNGQNHGDIWQNYANRVNRNLGYNIKRLASLDSEISNGVKQKAKYVVICKECGQEYTYNRKAKVFDYLDRCNCHKCKGSLKLIQNY